MMSGFKLLIAGLLAVVARGGGTAGVPQAGGAVGSGGSRAAEASSPKPECAWQSSCEDHWAPAHCVSTPPTLEDCIVVCHGASSPNELCAILATNEDRVLVQC